MSRLSREKKREEKRAVRSTASVAAPIAVHVPADGAGSGPLAGAWASVGGVRIHPAPGEEIQQAVLNHLHRIALATGRPVLATVTDERIGYVVPLQVHADGSSTFTAEPRRTAVPESAGAAPWPSRAAHPGTPSRETPPGTPRGARPQEDTATHVLRRVPAPAHEPAPTFPLRAVPRSRSADEPAPVFAPPAVPGQPDGAGPTVSRAAFPAAVPGTPPGTATAPTGQFGPPPVMDAGPAAAGTASGAAPAPGAAPEAADLADTVVGPEAVVDPDPKPTPVRGFDAVAEAVLGEDPRNAPGDSGPVLLAQPLARVNEAVGAGRIEEAAALADSTLTEASATLGPDHPEVLRLRELSAYIAYLSGDPLRAFRISLDLARVHRRAGDEEGAYGDVLSAATAWRAVRDPDRGLGLGRELIGLWTELTAEDGPAAEDIEELDSARARMGRLTERARRQAAGPGPAA